MRTLLQAILRFTLRIFFRRIEIVGAERVPAQGPVIFVLNHPNGLIDPAVLRKVIVWTHGRAAQSGRSISSKAVCQAGSLALRL